MKKRTAPSHVPRRRASKLSIVLLMQSMELNCRTCNDRTKLRVEDPSCRLDSRLVQGESRISHHEIRASNDEMLSK
ncbi:hypothetical protein K437DRAFT_6450 [Tilletiaria anomala UBC 951]|uniref:Uncharacterized protein n=1 Tax=Tilletiaria anomala (strain ATCC 24038 / CBS 436.72 / UBC 951) TaxID=1037660 RepID=A0A066WFA5_TILAU|nr:uncharacterized protein K437DRAFT_6450 [Tilletiaria anomala UBC 951]KDN52451.1 hypothetical protein K437DRAFT_6450 [Tilletiaria anomala UBC 951]